MRKVSQIKALFVAFILFFAFQNCSQSGFNQPFESQFSSSSSEDSQSSNGDDTDPDDSNPGTPSTPVIPIPPPPTGGGNNPPIVDSTISQKYANDQGIDGDSAVLFHSNFENGMAGWTSYSSNLINNEALITVMNSSSTANGGSRYMQARITKSQLAVQQYISANAQINLSSGVTTLYTRYYTKVVGQTAHPHHWVRFGAGNHYDGMANTVPSGNSGFWYDLDLGADGLLSFYVYWHQMRSGRCNNGTTVPGCAGDKVRLITMAILFFLKIKRFSRVTSGFALKQ